MESFASETQSTGEEVDADLEDIMWSLMKKAGFLSDLKTRILKFIDMSGILADDINVIPERAHTQILSQIYEYLEWVGMKSTCATLLVESPVPIDTPTTSADGQKPTLLALIDELNSNMKKLEQNQSEHPPLIPDDQKAKLLSLLSATDDDVNANKENVDESHSGKSPKLGQMNETYDLIKEVREMSISIASEEKSQLTEPETEVDGNDNSKSSN